MEVAILMSVGLHISLKGILERVNGLLLFISTSRCLQNITVCLKNQVARVLVGKGNEPCEGMAGALSPQDYWLTQNRNNFDNEQGAEEKTIKDVFIRKFTFGTFHTCHHHSLTDLQEVTGGIGVHGKYLLYFSTTETKSSLFTCPIKYKENMIIMLHYYDPYQPKYCKL
uniref:Uncharacterized protein n=1 Tax=Erpetoichthys calabaricus TaxID=27687 RepID=A0A8C4TLI5_ERPCA